MAGRDPDGLNWPERRAGDPGHDRIAAFLVLDVQGSRAWADEILGRIDDVICGEAPGWQMSMNAHELQIGPEVSVISPLGDAGDERPETVSTLDLRAALVCWIGNLSGMDDGG